MRMFTAGLVPVYSANVPRFSDTLPPHSLLSQPLMLVLMSSTLTLLDHFHHHKDSHILLTCVDCFTRWPEAISHIMAEAVAQVFLSDWISRFGVPSTIVTDRGPQFESQLWNTLMTHLGSKWARTTATTNGVVERFHRQLKAALKAQPQPDSWIVYHLFSLELKPLSRRTYPQRLQRWCTAQLSIFLENSSPSLKHLCCLTHLTMYPTSELTHRLSDLLHPVLPSGTATSLMVYLLLPM